MGSRKVRQGVSVDLAPPWRKRPKPRWWRRIKVDSFQRSLNAPGPEAVDGATPFPKLQFLRSAFRRVMGRG